MVWTSDQIAGDELRSIVEELRPSLEISFLELGFATNDGVRFFRRRGHLIHYFKLVVQSLNMGDHGARTSGNHLGFHFGEALDLTPGLAIREGEKTSATVVEENTDVYSIAKSSHYAKAIAKTLSAAKSIDGGRWAQLQSENDYLDFHLRCSPSIEKIYLLTLQDKHDEADAWLRLLLHESRAIRTISEKGAGAEIEIYKDPPGECELAFSKQSKTERMRAVEQEIDKNIAFNEIGFLYEAT